MDSTGGNSGRGRGRGRGGGRGGRGTRGSSRGGRGRGNFNNQDQGHRVGDRIVLSSVDAGFAPPEPPAKNSYRSKLIQTGTEEILGTIIEPENDLPLSNKNNLLLKQKDVKETIAEPSIIVSDDDIDMNELPETTPDGLITQLRERPIVKASDKKPEFNGYKDIWERGQYNRVTRVIGDFPKAKDRCFVVRPIPRAQPVHYLNKFARQKLPLAEPHFKKIKPQPPMTFTSQAVYQQFRGTEACSKVAGHVLSNIFENPQSCNKLFSIQIPNSIKTLSNANDGNSDDIKIAEQNVLKNDAESELTTTTKSQLLKMKKPRYHILTQFSEDEPFGKLQLLKSGRVVLRVGNRVFDVCTSTQNHDTHVGAIFEHETIEEKSRASTNTNENRAAASNNHQDNLFLLGKIENFFTAYYDYQKILNELDCAKSG
uniref:Uncharacterized protein n=1 Tax=Panagrolaimus sp. PS1159 TaxID=55785 RepID=A0AC35FFL9_9BILA